MASYYPFDPELNKIGDIIIQWARPDGWPSSHTEKWWLADFSSAITIAVGYLVFVIVCWFFGKVLDFPAIPGLYRFKFAYNIIQVMLCSYMCIEAGVQAYSAGYTILPCQPFNHEKPPIAWILYVFYLSKVLDFLDTVFIIAEKRWNQLSFLHVYHHFSIFLFYWLNINVGYDGDVYLTIVLNGLIHTIMYTYYFVSLHSCKEGHKVDIEWKSALTFGQMIQFVVMNLQAVYLLYNDCNTYPRNITTAYGYYILTLLFLFAHFYVLSYMVPKKKSDKKKSDKKEK